MPKQNRHSYLLAAIAIVIILFLLLITPPAQADTENDQQNSIFPISDFVQLVNRNYCLSQDYVSADLVRLLKYVKYGRNGYLNQTAVEHMADMFDGYFAYAGEYLFALSPYRDYKLQLGLLNNSINKKMAAGMSYEAAYLLTIQSIAPPGASEHQTGLTCDISAYGYAHYTISKSFETKKAGRWLRANCSKYGFILRYDKDKTVITGYTYEPWHFRYIGNPYATYIMDNELSLEQFYALLERDNLLLYNFPGGADPQEPAGYYLLFLSYKQPAELPPIIHDYLYSCSSAYVGTNSRIYSLYLPTDSLLLNLLQKADMAYLQSALHMDAADLLDLVLFSQQTIRVDPSLPPALRFFQAQHQKKELFSRLPAELLSLVPTYNSYNSLRWPQISP